MRLRRLLSALVISVVAAAGLSGSPTASADAGNIGPGSMMVTAGGQCTANFVFKTGSGASVKHYLGYAAHCASGTGATTNGCDVTNEPFDYGTEVDIEGTDNPGKLRYSSWKEMQANGWEPGGANSDECAYNDFALVEIDAADNGLVNATVPFFGGPSGLADEATDIVNGYGNSLLRLGVGVLKPKVGAWLFDVGSGWGHVVYMATPGIPGDSGSGLLTDDGRALGVASTITVAPLAGSNTYTDVKKALAFANAEGPVSNLSLVTSTGSGQDEFQPLWPLLVT